MLFRSGHGVWVSLVPMGITSPLDTVKTFPGRKTIYEEVQTGCLGIEEMGLPLEQHGVLRTHECINEEED